jgi:serine/threonine-protein kinase RsbT
MMPARESITIGEQSDVVRIRHAVRAITIELHFSVVDQTKIVTAASELGRNTLIHGHGGRCSIETLDQDGRVGIRLTFEDEGPGIADIQLALKDGYTSGDGMGLGLGGAKRLMSEFSIVSTPGKGTKVSVIRWKP